MRGSLSYTACELYSNAMRPRIRISTAPVQLIRFRGLLVSATATLRGARATTDSYTAVRDACTIRLCDQALVYDRSEPIKCVTRLVERPHAALVASQTQAKTVVRRPGNTGAKLQHASQVTAT